MTKPFYSSAAQLDLANILKNIALAGGALMYAGTAKDSAVIGE